MWIYFSILDFIVLIGKGEWSGGTAPTYEINSGAGLSSGS
jgi:hypothetical protein